MTGPADPADPAEPADSADPEDRADPTHPAEPVERADPTHPADPGAELGAERGAEPGADPIAARRRQAARWVAAGKRVGYAAILVAIAAFAVAVPTDFPSWAVTTVVVAFGVSCVTLLPAVIAGYGINAARREDRERGLPG